MSKHVIENIDNVRVAQNEPYVYHTINRNLEKLLDNDLRLRELYDQIFANFQIKEYNPGVSYAAGNLVWLVKGGELYLLKNLIPNNSNDLTPEYVGAKQFLELGWKNCNEYINILDMGLAQALSAAIEAKLTQHVDQYHPYGPVSIDKYSSNYVENKFLTNDMTNIARPRQTTFFPRAVYKFEDDKVVVLNGLCRIYDTSINEKYGLVEYDIQFKLGSSGEDLENMFTVRQSLSANNLVIKPYTGTSMATASANRNRDYFTNTAQMDIFNQTTKTSYKSQVGSIYQYNRNDYVNTYSATICFPYNFVDLNYMVFSNSQLSQSSGNTLTQSANEIIFCNKQRDSISVIDITFPTGSTFGNGENAENGGLASNCFSCKIIGIAQV